MSSSLALTPTARNATLWGIAYTVLATLCFATLDATSQLIGLAAPIVMVQWLRYGVQVASSGVVMAGTGELRELKIHRPALHISRG
ncbi:MAG: hypothetical protein ACKO1L_11060, partial [Brachymonas sp.]